MAGKEMLCVIFCPEDSEKYKFFDLKKCNDNDYILKKV